MHENFLSYIMIGLSRGLFPSASQSCRRFDEEAYLMREAALLRREKRAEARRQPELPSAGTAAEAADRPEPGIRRPTAFCRHGGERGKSAIGFASSRSCPAA